MESIVYVGMDVHKDSYSICCYKAKEDKDKIAVLNGMFLTIFSLIGVIAIIAGIILVLNTELIFGSELTNAELSRAQILMIILVCAAFITDQLKIKKYL